jgi:hypothetical protein
MNAVISVEIRSDTLGGWWAYVTQQPDEPLDPNIRRIGRKFRTNQEAWQWAMRKASSMQGAKS